MIYTELAFWKATAERAIKTAAQTAVALIGTDQVGILALDWAEIGAVVATATVLSVLSSVASGIGGSPALGRTERLDVPTRVGQYGGASLEAVVPDPDAPRPEDEEDGTEDLDETDDPGVTSLDAWELSLLAENEQDATPPPEGWEPRH